MFYIMQLKKIFMRKTKMIFLGALSVILSYIVFYYVTTEFFYIVYQGSENLIVPLLMIIYVMQTILCFYVIVSVANHKIEIKNNKLLWALYAVFMILFLFGRESVGNSFHITISIWQDFSYENILQIILNFIFFLPVGYILRKFSRKKSILLSLIFVIGIEFLQGITHRGICDSIDLITDLCAIQFSYSLCRRMQKKHSLSQ